MKKLFSIVLGLSLVLGFAGIVSAKGLDEHFAKGEKVDWNLSGAVMPVPPYGSIDIPSSDTKSKLTVNQPRCDTKTKINGEMKGLNPSTIYTVYLSNGYIPYKDTGWNVGGSWISVHEFEGNIYKHANNIVQAPDGTLTGNGGWDGTQNDNPISTPNTWVIDSGSLVSGNTIHLNYHYTTVETCAFNGYVDAVIATDGSMTGTWHDDCNGGRTGTWNSASGIAVKTHTGDMGWPNFFTSTVPAFTFTTNRMGMGNWHLNLGKKDFPAAGTYTLSAWINGGGATILISDNFKVVVPLSNKWCRDDREEDHDSREFRDFGWKMPFRK